MTISKTSRISHEISSVHKFFGPLTYAFLLFAFLLSFGNSAQGRIVPKNKKGNQAEIQRFMRQKNTLSNLDFYFTNRGVIFNHDAASGLYWPRGTNNSYIFGGGLWFGAKKTIAGRRRKLAELGYNPNSGAGWFTEGQINSADDGIPTDSKYISYLSPRYDKTNGKYQAGPNVFVPPPAVSWPIWDTASSKHLKRNFYFGDYIDNASIRSIEKLSTGTKIAAPAMLSQEDIVNIYTDADVTANPEYKPNTGYPFNLNIVEVMYTWSFGRYRDMLFLRHKVTNASSDSLLECFLAPAFDPDIGSLGGQLAASNDYNAYVSDSDARAIKALKGTVYEGHPSDLNMAYQFSAPEAGNELGWLGVSFLESPVVDERGNIIDNSDSARVGGYGPNGRKQLGLTTFKKWTISNDPPTGDLRYDFIAAGTRDPLNSTAGDMRLLFSTGPFTLPPGRSVETTVGIAIAKASNTDRYANYDSLLRLMVFAHKVFADTTGSSLLGDSGAVVVNHFLAPTPPDIPNLKSEALDRAVLLRWDSTSERSQDIISNPDSNNPKSLNFLGYQLWRSTRSDLDSAIRPDGVNPVIKLKEWALYDFRKDSVLDSRGRLTGFRYVRINRIPHEISHTYLDVGDDNHDGVLTGKEGLINGVKYYYYLVAFDEIDTINNVGPLTTAVVAPKNFISEIPTKPPYLGELNTTLNPLGCLAGGIDTITIDVLDSGRFMKLYANDTICVAFQPRWTEYNNRNFSRPFIYVDVKNERNNIDLTYDKLYNPSGSPVYTPYNFDAGLRYFVPGLEQQDSVFKGAFSTENSDFAPYQKIGESFRILVNYQFHQLQSSYKLKRVVVEGQASPGIVRLSQRTLNPTVANPPELDLSNIDTSLVRPSFVGSLGEVTYEVRFGDARPLDDKDFDTATRKVISVTALKDPVSKSIFTPQVLPVTVISKTHCDAPLKLIRPGIRNDIQTELLSYFYRSTTTQMGNVFANFNDPDTMLVPIPGKYAVDAFHFIYDNGGNPSSDSRYFGKTTGGVYFPSWAQGSVDASTNKALATVHRIRLAGAEIILNQPGINQPVTTGDTIFQSSAYPNDFRPGDKITVEFTGSTKALPFPDSCFKIFTQKNSPINYADINQYKNLLDQVQVVPNPYIVTHLGQTSTDNAKLYFTRLPPRATIEIYTVSGNLIRTLEHNGYSYTVNANADTTYDYTSLQDRASVEEWNLLTDGRQRVGSQVLIARIVARDPRDGSIIAETTTKFAIVAGGFHIVR